MSMTRTEMIETLEEGLMRHPMYTEGMRDIHQTSAMRKVLDALKAEEAKSKRIVDVVNRVARTWTAADNAHYRHLDLAPRATVAE